MRIAFESLTDRQKWAIEARLRANEDPQLRHFPLKWIGQDRRGYALVKTRFQTSLGLQGREAGWVIDNAPTADFSTIAAAGTSRATLTSFPLFNPAHVLGSLDPEPYEQSTLAAAVGDRQVGSSSQPVAILLGAYVVHITSAAAVFQPAATTANVRVISTVGATGGAFTTLATLAINAATNFVDTIPITATTGRHVSITGTDLTNIAALFNGDTLFVEMVAGASFATNVVSVIGEIV